MAKNNTVGTKSNFADRPLIPADQKLTAAEWNETSDFQKSPAQQIAGSLDDTDIIIDGTKQYGTTIVETGSTRTITANAAGHLKGNHLIQRYQFDVDCTLTLTNFDATGNNTGPITPISAGTYDLKYLSKANGINLEIDVNSDSEHDYKTWYVDDNAGNDGSYQDSDGDKDTGVRFYIDNKETLVLFKYTPHVTYVSAGGANYLFDWIWRNWF